MTINYYLIVLKIEFPQNCQAVKFVSSQLLQIVLTQIQNSQLTQNRKSLILDAADFATTQVQFLKTTSPCNGFRINILGNVFSLWELVLFENHSNCKSYNQTAYFIYI